jgi:crotonobetainyl-CoA:carnitine CoA-transferase CaiB-like acyl-CoA transferase
MPIDKPLGGITLVEAVGTTGPAALSLAARMCGRIASDLGARVVRLAPVGATSEPARDCFLDIGKEIVPVRSDDISERLAAFADADCVVVDASVVDRFKGRDRGPCMVVLAMSLDDPLGGSEFTVEARSGLMDLVGEPDRAPLRLGGHQIAYATGLAAYLAVIDLCARRAPGTAPSSRRVDLLDIAVWLNWKAVGAAALGLPVPTRLGTNGDWVVVPCLDGFVALVYRSVDWDALREALGEPRLDVAGFSTEAGRRENRGAVNAILADVFARMSRADIRRLSMAHRIPLGPVWTPEELRDDPHFRHRGFFQLVACDGDQMALPLIPVKWSGTRFTPDPATGVKRSADAKRRFGMPLPRGAETSLEKSKQSLSSYRVLDLGIITAGAGTSAILADLGADVIKIESPTYQDPFRRWDGEMLDGQHPDLPPYFRMTNRGKRNLGLDLKTKEGRDVFLRLVKSSDVIVENFRRGVLDKLGLGYEVLKAANPDIILASISSQGEDGPDSAYVSFGSTLEAMSGLAATTGYEDGPPVVTGKEMNYPDQVVAIFAASMIETARLARSRGRGGVHLDLSQRELTSFLCGDAFASGGGRRGNSENGAVMQGCYLSADSTWIAAAISDADLARLNTAGCGESREAIAQWIASMNAASALAALAKLAIPAAPVASGAGALADRTVGWERAVAVDPGRGAVKGVLFDSGVTPASLRRPAALVGADTREVLIEAGGYTSFEIDALSGVFVRPEHLRKSQVRPQ